MTWTKLPALENPGFRSNCLTCGPQPVTLPLEADVFVGFGDCRVTKDSLVVYDEKSLKDGEEPPRLKKFETEMAALDPDHDWRVRFSRPLSDTCYQRQGPGLWVLVEKGEGFA